jgi:hypothetical protein
MKVVVSVAFAILCALWGVPAYAHDTTHLIQPGIGIGPARLGVPLGRVIALWGPPRGTARKLRGFTVYCWCEFTIRSDGSMVVIRGGTSAVVDPSGTVIGLGVIDDASYALPEGIHTHTLSRPYTGIESYTRIGSSGREVRAALGEPDRIIPFDPGGMEWDYPRRGLMLFLHPNVLPAEGGAVYQIVVRARDLSTP